MNIKQLVEMLPKELVGGKELLTLNYTKKFLSKDINGNSHYRYNFYTIKGAKIVDITLQVADLTGNKVTSKAIKKSCLYEDFIKGYDTKAEDIQENLTRAITEQDDLVMGMQINEIF